MSLVRITFSCSATCFSTPYIQLGFSMMYITTLALKVRVWDAWFLLCVYIMCECQSLGYTNECVCVCRVGGREKERERNGERDRKKPEIT